MKRTIITLSLALALLAGAISAFPQQNPAAKPDRGKILGTWHMEVYADAVIDLTLVLEEAEGKLVGKISEPNGMFTDSPLSNIEYDGEALAFEITVASPPDGGVKTWKIQLTIGADVAEGVIANADLGLSAQLSGKRSK